MDFLKRAKEVFDIEAKAVLGMKANLDGGFRDAVGIIRACRGRVVVTGMGKAGIIGQKLSATLASTGTPSPFFCIPPKPYTEISAGSPGRTWWLCYLTAARLTRSVS